MDQDLSQLFLMLGRLESKVDALLKNEETSSIRMTKVEARLTDLETMRTKGEGLFSGVRLIYLAGVALLGAFSDTIVHAIWK